MFSPRGEVEGIPWGLDSQKIPTVGNSLEQLDTRADLSVAGNSRRNYVYIMPMLGIFSTKLLLMGRELEPATPTPPHFHNCLIPQGNPNAPPLGENTDRCIWPLKQ